MTFNIPHYLLFSEASQDRCPLPTWRFVLQPVNVDGSQERRRRFAATDSEPCDCGERLELLAVVRGLEALDGPARVTLVTKSRYVSRGIKKGLAQWRNNNWRWERFGRIVPVRDCDLWQRVERAMQFHEVQCQAWQFESTDLEHAPASSTSNDEMSVITGRTRRRVDSAHPSQGPRVVHPVQRLKRRAKKQAGQLSAAIRSITGSLGENVGAA